MDHLALEHSLAQLKAMDIDTIVTMAPASSSSSSSSPSLDASSSSSNGIATSHGDDDDDVASSSEFSLLSLSLAGSLPASPPSELAITPPPLASTSSSSSSSSSSSASSSSADLIAIADQAAAAAGRGAIITSKASNRIAVVSRKAERFIVNHRQHHHNHKQQQQFSQQQHHQKCNCSCGSNTGGDGVLASSSQRSITQSTTTVSRNQVQKYAADVVRREAQALLDLAARLDAEAEVHEEIEEDGDDTLEPEEVEGIALPPTRKRSFINNGNEDDDKGAERIRKSANFANAIQILQDMHPDGKIILTGVGKSGLLARKAVATLNSFGIPSAFLHPLEALHGDLGLISSHGLDTIILVSYSGRTSELLHLLRHLRHRKVHACISLSSPDSALADACDVNIDVSLRDDEEAEESVPAPTSSVVTALAALDAIALTLLRLRTGWESHPEERKKAFGMHHPGGSLGQQLSVHLE